MKRCLICLFSLISSVTSMAQEPWLLHRYDETNSSLEGRITQVLQDHDGMLWVATWNGLCRFDGYEFLTIKPQPGDSCRMASDRIRDIWLSDDGNDIYVKAEDDYYRLDLRTYRYHNISGDEELQRIEYLRRNQPGRSKIVEGGRSFIDAQGLEWRTNDNVLYCMSRMTDPANPIDMGRQAQVRCLKRDSHGRIWVCTKEEASVRLFSSDGTPLGYIDAAGRCSKAYRPFSDGVYCMVETRDGHLWMGCKPGGLLRLTEQDGGNFRIERIEGLANTNVYGITEDRQGRLWVATLGGGVSCVENPSDPHPTIVNDLPGFPDGLCMKVRYVHITPNGVMLAATTGGLVVAKVEDDIRNMRFHRHMKEPGRSTSLSCNAIIDIAQTSDDRIFLATETSGVCEIVSPDLLTDTLTFRHYNMQNDQLPTDMTQAMADMGNGHLLITGITKIVDLDINRNSYRSFGHLFFLKPYKFSEARPLITDDGHWIVGTTDGAFWLDRELARRQAYQPPLLLTGITMQGSADTDNSDNGSGTRMLAVNRLDTLRLGPTERSLTIHFAALDFIDSQAISYQFRMGTDSTAR